MIRGPRVQIRPVEREHLEFLVQLADDSVVRDNVVGWEWPLSRSGQDFWYEKTLSDPHTKRFIVEDREGNPIGLTGLWDIDWHNRNALSALKLGGAPGVRMKGLGTESILLIMKFAFHDVGLNRLYSSILSSNLASMGAYVNKCGWSEEGVSREHVWRAGNYVDLVQVGVLASDYETRREEFDEIIRVKEEGNARL